MTTQLIGLISSEAGAAAAVVGQMVRSFSGMPTSTKVKTLFGIALAVGGYGITLYSVQIMLMDSGRFNYAFNNLIGGLFFSVYGTAIVFPTSVVLAPVVAPATLRIRNSAPPPHLPHA